MASVVEVWEAEEAELLLPSQVRSSQSSRSWVEVCGDVKQEPDAFLFWHVRAVHLKLSRAQNTPEHPARSMQSERGRGAGMWLQGGGGMGGYVQLVHRET